VSPRAQLVIIIISSASDTCEVMSRPTFDADEKSSLANGRPGGVKRHRDEVGGVDDQRLFAERSAVAQVNFRRVIVVCRA